MAIPTTVAEAAALLELRPGADADAVRKRYRELAKQHHPDLNRHDPEASQRMAELNRARALLKDGVPSAFHVSAPESSAPRPRPAQTPEERAETRQAFRAEMEHRRRTDEARRRARSRRMRQAREAEEARHRKQQTSSREAAPETREAQSPPRRRSAPARRRPLDRVYDFLAERGWGEAVKAARRSRIPSDGLPLFVHHQGGKRAAAVVFIAPSGALTPQMLDRAIASAEQFGAAYAYVMDTRVFRRANLRKRTRTNAMPLSKFPTPDELSGELDERDQ